MIFRFSYPISSWLGVKSAEIEADGSSVHDLFTSWLVHSPACYQALRDRNIGGENGRKLLFVHNGKSLRTWDIPGEDDEVGVFFTPDGG